VADAVLVADKRPALQQSRRDMIPNEDPDD